MGLFEANGIFYRDDDIFLQKYHNKIDSEVPFDEWKANHFVYDAAPTDEDFLAAAKASSALSTTLPSCIATPYFLSMDFP